MAPHIFPRQESSVTSNYIAGGLLAGFVSFLVITLLLCLRFHRSRADKKKRIESFFRVTDVIRPMGVEPNSSSASIPPPFSRSALTASIVMPEKSVTRKPSSHALSDRTVVSPHFAPSPASSTQSLGRPLSSTRSGSPRPRALSNLNPARSRHSRSSSGFSAYAETPFPPGLNARPPFVSSMAPSQARVVRQLFEPVLPDELSLVRYGECLTVLQSFDDGWCLVARDASRPSRSSRLSPHTTSSDNVDIGLVPAWVFVKPPKGIAPTRPFRNPSVNALYLCQNPTGRDAIISWSNFV